MQKSILSELYYGNVQPHAKQIVKNSKYESAIKLIFENEQALGKLLDEKHFVLLEQIANAHGDIDEILAREHFIEGFKLAVQLVFAGLSDDMSSEIQSITEMQEN